MKAVVHGLYTEIFPEITDVKKLCKIGEGAETCIFLTMGNNGWECYGRNKQPIWALIQRARRGETNARREGCDTVLNWVPDKLGESEIAV